MGDILDNKPPFTIIMGCDGCGKTIWKRANREALATIHIDLDSIADGIGNWDDEECRDEALRFSEAKIAECLREHQPYGVESTYSGPRGPKQVTLAKQHGYRIHGYYLGTSSPEINIERINQRVRERTGHWVDPKSIPNRWAFSLSNLKKTVELFDELTIYDNSLDYNLGVEEPPTMAFFERGYGMLLVKDNEIPEWFSQWHTGWEARKYELNRAARKKKKGQKLE